MLALTLLLLAAPAPPTTAEAQLLTGVVAGAAAKSGRFDVLTASDVRTAAGLEAERQMMGCSESSSCLAEIASALDARFVISGTLGLLGDELVLQLSVLDVKEARSIGRHTLRGGDAGDLGRQAEAAVDASLAAVSGDALRVVVLDVTLAAPAAASSTPAPTASSSSLPLWGGVGAGVGAVVLAAGLGLDLWSAQSFAATSADKDKSAAAANADYDVSDGLAVGAGVGYVVGGVLVVVGGAVAVAGLVGE